MEDSALCYCGHVYDEHDPGEGHVCEAGSCPCEMFDHDVDGEQELRRYDDAG